MSLKIEIYGGDNMVKKKQAWYMQRRIWATVLSVISIIAVSYDQSQIVMLCSALAGTFGLHSYIKPKK